MKKIEFKKPCPFEVIDINTKAKEWQGAANFIHKKTSECIALVHGHFVDDLKELVKTSWGKKIGTCPFEIIDVISPGYEGFVNFIHVKTSLPIALVHKNFAEELKEVINAWDKE